MTDEQLKKIAFAQLILDQVKYFNEYVDDKEPEEFYCCNGEMCGCGGMTNREHWKLLANYDGKTVEEAAK